MSDSPVRSVFRSLSIAVLLGMVFVARWDAPAVAQQGRAALDAYSFGAAHTRQWKLPPKLTEISGLARAPDGRIFAHDDEHGIIYEINSADGRLVKAFALGEVTAAGDFEGIAIADGRFYLVTSDGRIHEAGEGGNGERVPYNTFDTGVGRLCEVEGLMFEPADRSLLLLCKTPRVKDLDGQIAIYRWSVDDRRMMDAPPVLVSLAAITGILGISSFNPSAIERNPTTGTYFVAAARQNAVVEIAPDGVVLSARRLPSRHHSQVEGITFGAGLGLVLADEGGFGRGRLTIYQPGEGSRP